VRAIITLFDMPAQGGSTAGADVAESFPLLRRQGVPPSFEKSPLLLTKDIGHFEPMFSHLLLPSPSVVRTSRIGRSSSGLSVVCPASTIFSGQRQLFFPIDDNYKLYECLILG
jgi:hypothetical protein